MILSFRTWWRIVAVLGLVALLPLAWRGLDRQPPILIQQVPAGSEGVPPAVVTLARRGPAQARPAGPRVAEAAAEQAEAEVEERVGGSEAPEAWGALKETGKSPCPETPEDEPGPSEETAPSPPALQPAEDPPASTPGTAPGPRVNINTADAATLETLPGIGPALAARIIEYRARWGPFTAPEQLTEVSGIGEKRLEQLLPWITTE